MAMRGKLQASTRTILSSRTFQAIILFIILLIVLSTGIRLVLGSNTLGADFFTFWTAGKAVFTQQQSPYSNEVVQETQFGRYNRLALPGDDQLAFVYPFYMLFLVLPFSFINYPLAQAIWMALHLLLLITLTYLAFSSKRIWPALTVPFFYPMAFSQILGNFNLSIGLIFYFFFWAYFTRKIYNPAVQSLLGIGLAFAAGKPQFVYLLLLIACIILIKHKLWRTLAWFGGTLTTLLAFSFILLPDWIPQWLSRAQIYTQYTGTASVFSVIFSFVKNQQILSAVNLVLFIVLIVWLLIRLGRWLRQLLTRPKNKAEESEQALIIDHQVLFILALAGFITYLFHPFGKSYEQIIIFIPFFIWAASSLSTHPLSVHLFWWIGLAISWAAFIIARVSIYPQALYTLPVLFFLAWLAYLWYKNRSSPSKEVLHASS